MRYRTEDDRQSIAAHASLFAIAANVGLVVIKALIGFLSGSVAVLGDAVNNLSDAASGIITFIGFKVAARPADAEHPYGHGRMEYLSGLCVAVMILAIGVNLLMSSISKCLSPSFIDFSPIMAGLLLLSIAVKFGLMAFYTRVGKRIDSSAMHAAAVDSRNDILTTSAILLAALIEHLTHLPTDGPAGVLMAVYILWSGIQLLSEQVSPLLGRVPSGEEVEEIRRKILSTPNVLGMHDLMIHDYGPGREFGSAHVEISADFSPVTMHEIIDGIENQLLAECGIHFVLHCDPVVTEDPRIGEMKEFLTEVSGDIYKGMTVHDLRIVPAAVRPKVIFDCVVPFDCQTSFEEIEGRIRAAFKERYPEYLCVPTVEHSFTGA